MNPTNNLPYTDAHFIDMATAISMTTRYRQNVEGVLDPTYRNQGILPLNETFNRAALDSLLAIENCAGIRVYYGMDTELKLHCIMVAVNDINEDILGSPVGRNEEIIIIELAQRCPDLCPPASLLNS